MSVQRSWSNTSASSTSTIFWKISESSIRCSAVANLAASAHASGSIARRRPKNCEQNWSTSVRPSIHSISCGSRKFQYARSTTRVPIFGRDSNRPLEVNSLTASRSAVRLIPNCSHNAISPGIIEPCGRSPDKIPRAISRATCTCRLRFEPEIELKVLAISSLIYMLCLCII